MLDTNLMSVVYGCRAFYRARHLPVRERTALIAGITAYRTAFGRREAVVGRQPGGISGSELWVVPNPSGLNAHETTETLSQWYRQVAIAAGIVEATPA